MGIFSSDEEPMWSDVFALQDDLKRLQEENEKLKENQCCPETCEINLKYKQALEETLKILCNGRTFYEGYFDTPILSRTDKAIKVIKEVIE